MRGVDQVYSEICTDGFHFCLFFVTVFSGWRWICYRFASRTRSTTNWIHQVTGTKMAPSNLRNEIEQPQVFFYFPKDKKNVYICVFVICHFFYLFFFLHFSSMKTQRVNYESCSYSVCASFIVATRRRYWRRFVSARAFEDRRWWSVCVWIFCEEVNVSTRYWKVGFVYPN